MLSKKDDKRNLVDEYKGLKVDIIKAEVAARAFPYHIAIENFQHDFNIGAIVRNANAFTASGVHIIGKRHWNRRGAMATEKYLELHHHPNVTEFNEWAIRNKMPIIGIDNIKNSKLLQKADLPKKAVYVFGQEGPGLSSEMQQLCKSIVAIEQFGSTRSINVGVASGIFMYEYTRRHTEK